MTIMVTDPEERSPMAVREFRSLVGDGHPEAEHELVFRRLRALNDTAGVTRGRLGLALADLRDATDMLLHVGKNGADDPAATAVALVATQMLANAVKNYLADHRRGIAHGSWRIRPGPLLGEVTQPPEQGGPPPVPFS